MQPTGNNILFKPFQAKETTESGLFVPENCRPVSDRGVISEVGIGTKKRPMRLVKGQIAHRVHKWGQEVIIDGELHFIMDENAIIAVE